MPFSGQTSHEMLTATLVGEDVSALVGRLIPKEAPFVDFLTAGRGYVQARSTKHEFIQDNMLPNYIIASAAVNSATAATGILINGLGEALSVGTLLENESAAPELMQVTSIAGPNSILVSRDYDGGGKGSLVAGGQLYVRGMAGIEGSDHTGAHQTRLGTRSANTVGLFLIELAVSGTQRVLDANVYGNDTYAGARNKALVDAAHQLEKEIIRGKLNAANSLASTTTTRTMQGLKPQLTSIASVVVTASFSANPHLYIGNVFKNIFDAGASTTESWALVCGATRFADISNLNDTKVQDTNDREVFKRVIRTYTGPFGSCEVFVTRALPAAELLIVPRERVNPVVLRPWQFIDIAKTGDNDKSMLVGEYSVEVHHPAAMARIYS